MNGFTVSGKIVQVEDKETKMGTYFQIIWVDDMESHVVPLALFGYQSAEEGDEVHVKGIIEERNGYPALSVKSVSGIERLRPTPKIAGQRQPPPEAHRPDRPFTGQINRDSGPVGDELPF